VLKDSAKTS